MTSALRRARYLYTQRLLKRKLNHCRRIAFICSGNVIRSPFAAQHCVALAARAGAAVEVRSAGTCPSDRPESVPAFARIAAEPWGVDLSTHRSAAVSRALIRWADVVFVMDASHSAFLRQRCPEDMRKVFLLTAILPQTAGTGEIPDPISAPELCPEVYKTIAAAVEAAIDGLGSATRPTSTSRNG